MKRRALLLDRDGIINIDHGYVIERAQFQFQPQIFAFLNKVQDLGFRLAIVTNQSGVARGRYTKVQFEDLTTWMLSTLAEAGIVIDLVLACFEHPDGPVKEFSRQSYWRKPNPGMIKEAEARLSLDLARSAFLGDQISDGAAAIAAGIRTCLYLNPKQEPVPSGVRAIKDFAQALEILKDLNEHRS